MSDKLAEIRRLHKNRHPIYSDEGCDKCTLLQRITELERERDAARAVNKTTLNMAEADTGELRKEMAALSAQLRTARELAAKWRKLADDAPRPMGSGPDSHNAGAMTGRQRKLLRNCADELEQALASLGAPANFEPTSKCPSCGSEWEDTPAQQGEEKP